MLYVEYLYVCTPYTPIIVFCYPGSLTQLSAGTPRKADTAFMTHWWRIVHRM